MRTFAGVMVSVAIYGSTIAGATADEFLSKDQLQDFFIGRVVDTKTKDGIDVAFHFDADGTFRAFFNRPKNPHWSPGTWWVTDTGTMCTKNDKAETLCHKYRRDGDIYARFSVQGTPIPGKWEPRPKS